MIDVSKNPTINLDLDVRDLGRMPYVEAFDLQKRLQRDVIEARETPREGRLHLLLVEHDPPVVTISRRKTALGNLVATPQQLAKAGVEIHETDRGGDITYHGPGQLVVYPILDLNLLGLRLHSYMRFLEQVVIDTIDQFGVTGRRDPEATGVWVKKSHEPCARGHERDLATPSSKICAMGVRVSRWVSMHGLALNVNPDMAHYDLIVPCGLAGRSVTSLRNELGEACPTMSDVKTSLVEGFRHAINKQA